MFSYTKEQIKSLVSYEYIVKALNIWELVLEKNLKKHLSKFYSGYYFCTRVYFITTTSGALLKLSNNIQKLKKNQQNSELSFISI